VIVERIGNATLYCGDCLEVLPTLGEVDAVVTDPPYGTAHLGGYNRASEGIAGDGDLSVTIKALWLSAALSGGNAVVFSSPRMAPDMHAATEFLDWAGQAVWDKKLPGLGRGLRYQHENISFFGDAAKILPQFSVMSFFRDAERHPHQKPIEVMERVVRNYDADTILDPFMGSGTTGVACANLGRKFIGIEIEQKYFDIACERIEAAQSQGRLFA
jgi:DNA modification methylase